MTTKTIFKDDRRPHFYRDGSFYIPEGSVIFRSDCDPILTVNEWMYLLMDGGRLIPKRCYKEYIGSPVTIWRTRKSLERKGYL